jgi:hypothetical protein
MRPLCVRQDHSSGRHRQAAGQGCPAVGHAARRGRRSRASVQWTLMSLADLSAAAYLPKTGLCLAAGGHQHQRLGPAGCVKYGGDGGTGGKSESQGCGRVSNYAITTNNTWEHVKTDGGMEHCACHGHRQQQGDLPPPRQAATDCTDYPRHRTCSNADMARRAA